MLRSRSSDQFAGGASCQRAEYWLVDRMGDGADRPVGIQKVGAGGVAAAESRQLTGDRWLGWFVCDPQKTCMGLKTTGYVSRPGRGTVNGSPLADHDGGTDAVRNIAQTHRLVVLKDTVAQNDHSDRGIRAIGQFTRTKAADIIGRPQRGYNHLGIFFALEFEERWAWVAGALIGIYDRLPDGIVDDGCDRLLNINLLV